MSSSDLEALVREVRSRGEGGLDVRCPKPRYRWTPGAEGPCGRKLGELYAVPWGALIEVFAPIEQVVEAAQSRRMRWRLMAEPSIGRFHEPQRVGVAVSPVVVNDWPGSIFAGGASIDVPAGEGADIFIDCPRCGVSSDLPTLTGRSLMR